MPTDLLQRYLDKCSSTTCDQVRVYFLSQYASPAIPAPDLAIVNITVDCEEDYSGGDSVLLVTIDTALIVHTDTLQTYAQNWVNLPFQCYDYNKAVWAYTYQRGTFERMQGREFDQTKFQYSYHTHNTTLQGMEDDTSEFRGRMVIDLLASSSVSATIYDFANPCPPICGDTGKVRRFYPANSEHHCSVK